MAQKLTFAIRATIVLAPAALGSQARPRAGRALRGAVCGPNPPTLAPGSRQLLVRCVLVAADSLANGSALFGLALLSSATSLLATWGCLSGWIAAKESACDAQCAAGAIKLAERWARPPCCNSKCARRADKFGKEFGFSVSRIRSKQHLSAASRPSAEAVVWLAALS
jgi:hypothetical protein